ncbi:MAG: ABC transporter substrate-binding protein [Desulfobacterales bacterium]|nr:ABC transporter substrate-binding protein [Desulfobacterales bacterium]
MRRLVIISIIAVFVCVALGADAWAKETEPIKVGAVINLTGPASTWGQFHAKGQRDYFRYVNEKKGGVGGRKIDLTVVDHAYNSAEAVKFVKKFCAQDKMDMIATWDAASGLQAKPIVQKYKTPCINYSTAPEILNPPIEYMYLPFGSYTLDSQAVLEYIKAIHKGKGAPKVGLLTYNNPYGKSIHDPSKAYAAKNNIEIVGIEEFPSKAGGDLRTPLAVLRKAGAEYVFMQILPVHIANALRDADLIGYKVPFFGTWTATDPDFFGLAKGRIRNRLFMQFSGSLPTDNAPGVKLMMEIGQYSGIKEFDTSYWEGVVVGMIMERAFQLAQEKFGKINTKTINQAMELFRNEDFGGLIPKTSYAKDNHEGSFVARIVQIHEDATYTPMTNFFVPGKGQLKLKLK